MQLAKSSIFFRRVITAQAAQLYSHYSHQKEKESSFLRKEISRNVARIENVCYYCLFSILIIKISIIAKNLHL